MSRLRTGFTLLELLLVLVLIAVLAAMTATRLAPLRSARDVDNVAQLLSQKIQASQDMAGYRSQLVRFRLDLDERRYSIAVLDSALAHNADQSPTAASQRLSNSEALSITFMQDNGREQDSGVVDLIFYPDRRSDVMGVFTIQLAEQEKQVACYRSGRAPRVQQSL